LSRKRPTKIGVDSGEDSADGRGDQSGGEMSCDEIGKNDDENMDEDDQIYWFLIWAMKSLCEAVFYYTIYSQNHK
jgi:hypothetical protein